MDTMEIRTDPVSQLGLTRKMHTVQLRPEQTTLTTDGKFAGDAVDGQFALEAGVPLVQVEIDPDTNVPTGRTETVACALDWNTLGELQTGRFIKRQAATIMCLLWGKETSPHFLESLQNDPDFQDEGRDSILNTLKGYREQDGFLEAKHGRNLRSRKGDQRRVVANTPKKSKDWDFAHRDDIKDLDDNHVHEDESEVSAYSCSTSIASTIDLEGTGFIHPAAQHGLTTRQREQRQKLLELLGSLVPEILRACVSYEEFQIMKFYGEVNNVFAFGHPDNFLATGCQMNITAVGETILKSLGEQSASLHNDSQDTLWTVFWIFLRLVPGGE
jgi:hypothetical protein